MATVIVISASYPFGNGDAYFEPELPFLTEAFDQVVLAPRRRIKGDVRKLAPNCIVLEPSSQFGYFLAGILELPRHLLGGLRSKAKPFILFKHAAQAGIARRQLREAKRRGLIQGNGENTIAYSLWLCGAVLAADSFRKKEAPAMKVVSRSHRVDQFLGLSGYPECLWNEKLAASDWLFPVSVAGLNVFKQFEESRGKCTLFRHGVRDLGGLNPAPEARLLRLVSCSWVSPVKRVHLIARAVAEVKKRLGPGSIHWTHIGDGVETESLQSLCSSILEPEDYRFLGRMANAKIREHYSVEPYHAFVHASESEGVPTAIMEAFAHGIPVITTDVGGTGEIVSDRNGVLLPGDDPLQPMIDSLLDIAANPERWTGLRQGARETWVEMCDAATALPKLCRTLYELTVK